MSCNCLTALTSSLFFGWWGLLCSFQDEREGFLWRMSMKDVYEGLPMHCALYWVSHEHSLPNPTAPGSCWFYSQVYWEQQEKEGGIICLGSNLLCLFRRYCIFAAGWRCAILEPFLSHACKSYSCYFLHGISRNGGYALYFSHHHDQIPERQQCKGRKVYFVLHF